MPYSSRAVTAEALKTITAPIRQSASVTPKSLRSGWRLRGIVILFPAWRGVPAGGILFRELAEPAP